MGNRGPKLTSLEVEELTKLTHFNSKELQYWYRRFLEDCPSGSLNSQDFYIVFQKHFSFGSSMELANLLFSTMELNEDGLVGFHQFVQVFSTVLAGTQEERLNWLFLLCDQDKDGLVSRSEIISVIDPLYQFLGPLSDCKDDELPPKSINLLFLEGGEIDVYKKIGKEEFMEMFSNETFVKASNTCSSINFDLKTT